MEVWNHGRGTVAPTLCLVRFKCIFSTDGVRIEEGVDD